MLRLTHLNVYNLRYHRLRHAAYFLPGHMHTGTHMAAKAKTHMATIFPLQIKLIGMFPVNLIPISTTV